MELLSEISCKKSFNNTALRGKQSSVLTPNIYKPHTTKEKAHNYEIQ